MKLIGLILASLLLTIGLALGLSSDQPDQEAIEGVIKEAYIEGIHNVGDPEAVRAGFHQEFTMFILRDGEIMQMTRDEWIERIEAGKKKNPDAERPKTTHEFRHIDVSGTAAIAALDVYKNGEHAYTDYMSLYKFKDGWKIIGKIFQSHR